MLEAAELEARRLVSSVAPRWPITPVWTPPRLRTQRRSAR